MKRVVPFSERWKDPRLVAEIGKMIHDLARAVIDRDVEIDDERQGAKFADDLGDDIATAIQIFVELKRAMRQRDARPDPQQ